MKKFGGPNKIRQKCRLRQCQNFSILGKHGNRKKEHSSNSESPYHEDQGLSSNKWKHRPSSEAEKRTVTSVTESTRIEYSGELSDDDDDEIPEKYSYRKSKKGRERRFSSSSDTGSPRKKYKRKEKVKAKHKVKDTQKKRKEKNSGSSSRRYSDLEDRQIVEVEEEAAFQCYGPGCIEPAMPGCKYCSDECGMKLAKNRIYELLPTKIQQWQSTPCIAEENNKKSLEKIRRQQLQARQKLGDLDLKHQELDALIERAKHATVSSDQEGTDGEDETESVYCVTCGGEINQRGALKHMEKCFAKFEMQTSFGSFYKSRIEGNSMFCDFYNSQQKTYCKRLKVLCPEHTKEPKVGQDEVCGCPLVSNVFDETGEFCRAQKRKCNKHYCWEKLRRAEIDMERVRQWLKLDELYEHERNIRVSMSNRVGVLGLMLHQTVDHDPLHPIKAPAN